MKIRLTTALFLSVILCAGAIKLPVAKTIGMGYQPQISTDVKGVIRVVFGRNDNIFCATSTDKGASFSTSVLVGHVAQMHLGMARGPQLASSARYSVVTAMDKKGDIHYFVLDHQKGKWQDMGFVNDTRSSAPEGLMNIACDSQDNFYATWLDIRLNKRNNIYFSAMVAGKGSWLKNKLIYRSPDGHVCECCRPSIAVKGSNIAVMFRNWLDGSRDLYLVTSDNKGLAFGNAAKLGKGTWQLNACPMDGGGLTFNADNTINTTWQRQGMVYYCKPGTTEKEVGKGRDCSIISDNGQTIVALTTGDEIKYRNIQTAAETTVGKGSYLKTMVLVGNKVLCIWENDKHIETKIL
ncbi:hypothetical protein [Mucilaginibacter ginsenosidivorans]|uniref:Exo-alpha-sialidase n=1 Tax=Mucilaginibacter ginsenosidivorans TaxID=398053 RepID=A0A5B8UWR7_9SPHI|nr:hypothetical protein [Mucilaginibacter ginsenosidivorans]QEC63484.1 hypothetical protein FRZ54_13145 [Mucilaginibacter ginsenosidivorans]